MEIAFLPFDITSGIKQAGPAAPSAFLSPALQAMQRLPRTGPVHCIDRADQEEKDPTCRGAMGIVLSGFQCLETITPEGFSTRRDPDGTVVTRTLEGVSTVTNPDGSFSRKYTDGRFETGEQFSHADALFHATPNSGCIIENQSARTTAQMTKDGLESFTLPFSGIVRAVYAHFYCTIHSPIAVQQFLLLQPPHQRVKRALIHIEVLFGQALHQRVPVLAFIYSMARGG